MEERFKWTTLVLGMTLVPAFLGGQGNLPPLMSDPAPSRATPEVPPAGEPPAKAAPLSGLPETPFIVLCYHRFVPKAWEKVVMNKAGHPVTIKNNEFQFPLDEFKWQMQYLRDNGFTPISAKQLTDHWFLGKPLPSKPVLITFDDGFRTVYEYAFPVIQQFGYSSIFFLYTGFLENEERALERGRTHKVDPNQEALHPQDILEMEKTGMDLEAHTNHHYNMGSMEEKSSAKAYTGLLEYEMNEPLTYIDGMYGHKPTMVAYPYGVYSPQILSQTKKSGYELAFTVNPGPNDRTVDPLKLRRNLVLYPISHSRFAQMFGDWVLHLEGLSPGDGQEIQTDKPLVTAKILDDIDPKSLEFVSGDIHFRISYDPRTHLVRHQFKQPLKGLGHMMTLSATGRDGKKRVYTWYFRVKRRPGTGEGDTE